MNWLVIHSIIAPVVVGLPLLVVLVVRFVVQRESVEAGRSRPLSGRELIALSIATAVVCAGFALWFVMDAESIAAGLRGPLPGIAEIGSALALFWLGAVPVLRSTERSALQLVREQAATEESRYRAAILQPRKLSSYLPVAVHLVGAVICIAVVLYVALQIQGADANARLLMPIGYGAAAATFFLLYEVWIRQEVQGAQAISETSGSAAKKAESTRRRRVREIFKLQMGLTVLFSVMALLALEVRWESQSGSLFGVMLGAVGGIVGGVGCAFAISSELRDSYLRLTLRKLV